MHLTRFISKIAGVQLDPDIAEVLATPVVGEGALIDAVAKTGGDESVQKAAVAVARTRAAISDAFGGKIPAKLAKAMGSFVNVHESAPAPRPSVEAKPAPVAKAKPTWTAGEILESVQKLDDREAARKLDAEIARIRKSEPHLSKERAFVKALDAHPDLYERVQRDAIRKAGSVAKAEPEVVHTDGRNWKPIENAAAALRKANPTLTEAQSIAKALEDDPTLYEAT